MTIQKLYGYGDDFGYGDVDTEADGDVETTTSERQYNNLWDYIRYGWEDLVNHPSSWGGLAVANSPGSTLNIPNALETAEMFHDSSAFDSNYNVDLPDIKPIAGNNPAVSDAMTYGKLQGDNVEQQLQWLINNDPENASGWMEQLIGLRASREVTQEARDYERFMSDTRIQRTAKDLEAAGINPILAYQFLSNSNGSVGAASMPDSNVSTNATSKANNKATNQVASGRAIIAIVTTLLAIAGIGLKAVL